MHLNPILSLTGQIQHLAQGSNKSGQHHKRLLQLVDDLKLAVETPTETVLRLIYQPPQNAALRVVVDLGIFNFLATKSIENRAVTATELSEFTGAGKGLIVRLMRVMTALRLCSCDKPESYRVTEKTAAMIEPIARYGIPCIYDLTVPTLSKLHEYLRLHHYVEPKEYAKSPMQWAVGKSQFEWLAENKHHQELFNSYMSSRRDGQPCWFDVYPIARLFDGAQYHHESIFLVDIGGNQGHDLAKFHARYPNAPGRLILQDLPTIVSCVQKPGIETMGYSFYDKQPVKNARAYYFRAIFHDWPDHICLKILLNTLRAMDTNYSRVIIVDFVLPDTDVSIVQSSMDIQMMSIGAGIERSRTQWTELLRRAGMKITGIWDTSAGMESVIEAAPILNGP